ncbi:PAS domain S-box protein [Candidatus Microgenomates bacterium]|nr:PAS domain S-box protein [Candidatus Microgenomates bacterium]
MARKLEVFIKQLTKNWFLYSLILLLALTIMVDYRFTDNISHKLGDLFYVLPLASLVLAALPLLHEWKLFRHKYMVLVMAYVVAGLFLVYLTGIFGPYFQILTLLLFASTFWYDWPGLLLSLSAALVILVLAVWYQFDNLSEQLFYIALIHYLTLLIIGILFERVSLRHRLRRSADTAELLQTVSFERTRLLSLINSMADAVMATDSDGKILLYNGAVLDLLNTNVSLENKLLQQFLALKDQQAKAVDVIKLAQQARTVLKRDDLYFISNENQKVRVYLSISPIHSSYGRLGNGGFIMVLRDITKEKSLDEERTEFISVTSHELKTPIAIAEANLSTALLPQLSEAVPANVRDLLEQAHNQIVFLGDLINDLTTLAKAERGDLGIDIEPIDPHALLKRLTEDYAAEVKA